MTGIWLYTHDVWGFDQAEKYYDLIVSCCEAVGNRKTRTRAIEGLSDDVRVHHCEQHYIFFLQKERPVIFAILHGRMDFIRQLQGRL